MNFTLTKDDYFPHPPKNKDLTIGIVGSGGIVRGAHLPAYRKAGYNVQICCDISADAARGTAEKFDIPRWTTNIQEVMDSGVDIIDLAVHAKVRRAVMEQICASPNKPRGILTQKPFALSLEDAEAMVEMCEAAGIKLMVNQQARYAPANRALKKVVDSGELGHIFSIVHFLRAWQDEPGSWYVAMPHFNLLDHGIHWIDLSRFFSGQTAALAKATTVMVPGQAAVSPMIYSATLEYPSNDLMSTLHFNNIVPTSASTGHHEWIIDGTGGTAMLSGDAVIFVSAAEPLVKHTFKTEGAWWNDAFGGTMGELMRALQENREPSPNGRDNLESIRTAQAMLRSSETGEAAAV